MQIHQFTDAAPIPVSIQLTIIERYTVTQYVQTYQSGKTPPSDGADLSAPWIQKFKLPTTYSNYTLYSIHTRTETLLEYDISSQSAAVIQFNLVSDTLLKETPSLYLSTA